MKILVTVKRVEDPEAKIKVKPDGTGIVTEGINYKVNPFDEIAVEEALRLRDAHGGEVVIVSCGGEASTTEIRSALAMGADRGILVKTDADLDSDAVARLLQRIVEKETPDLVIMGKQAVDDDQNQAGQRLAQYLGWAQATQASKRANLESEDEKAKKPGLVVADGALEVTREIDGGLEDLKLKLPALISADLRLNMPRYASLPGIMKAKKKPFETTTPEELGVDITPKITVKKLMAPPMRQAGEMVADVPTLVKKLAEEAKAI
ncbi:MAG: electron transfer flavoprotein subunit beta/FixA family protein [Myxococcota bacterium]